MPESWSTRIANRYCCDLSQQLTDWFDSEVWKQIGSSEFREPVDPQTLLERAPEVVWPGLMSCDFLPLIGNMAGDWLCVRMGQNSASEIVHWYHGGGDWIPWGKDLAEALVFDALIDRLPGPSARHAIPAETPRPDLPNSDDPILRWALKQLPVVEPAFDTDLKGSQLADLLISHSIAEVAVRCELICSALASAVDLEQTLQDLMLDAAPTAEWVFDHQRIPEDIRDQLRSVQASSLDQDWQIAEAQAMRITELSSELACGWDIAGYAAMRRGEDVLAQQRFEKGATCSVFTDQSIRLKTHWMSDRSMKFSVACLSLTNPRAVEESAYLQMLMGEDFSKQHVTNHWLDLGTEFHEAGEFERAWSCFMNAGWDVGAGPMHVYTDLLERVVDASDRANHGARAELARTHLRCLGERYSS
ncbi:MAG: hypothetical protein AB8B91_00735 [Rubripirellula sp.]